MPPPVRNLIALLFLLLWGEFRALVGCECRGLNAPEWGIPTHSLPRRRPFIAPFPFLVENTDLLYFSPDGRILICAYRMRNPFVSMPVELHRGFGEWLEERLPIRERLALFDLQTGKIWRDLLGDRWCANTDDGTR